MTDTLTLPVLRAAAWHEQRDVLERYLHKVDHACRCTRVGIDDGMLEKAFESVFSQTAADPEDGC